MIGLFVLILLIWGITAVAAERVKNESKIAAGLCVSKVAKEQTACLKVSRDSLKTCVKAAREQNKNNNESKTAAGRTVLKNALKECNANYKSGQKACKQTFEDGRKACKNLK